MLLITVHTSEHPDYQSIVRALSCFVKEHPEMSGITRILPPRGVAGLAYAARDYAMTQEYPRFRSFLGFAIVLTEQDFNNLLTD